MSTLRSLPETVEEAISAAQKNRSDLLSVQADMQRIQHQKRAASFEWLPVVDSNLNYSFSNNIAFSDQNTLWSLQVNANWLLWDGGHRIQQHRMEQLQDAVRSIEHQQLQDTIETEITQAWNKREILNAQLEKSRLDQQAAQLNLQSLQKGHTSKLVRDWDLRQAKLLLSQSNYLYLQLESELYLQNFKLLMLCYESAFTR